MFEKAELNKAKWITFWSNFSEPSISLCKLFLKKGAVSASCSF